MVECFQQLVGSLHFSLVDNRNLIGRADDCDIVLAEPEVSRHHAVVFREGGSLWVADLHSANGTTVNDTDTTTTTIDQDPAVDLVKSGEAQACVSAGNTGALMATAKFVLKTRPDVLREGS